MDSNIFTFRTLKNFTSLNLNVYFLVNFGKWVSKSFFVGTNVHTLTPRGKFLRY